MSRQRALTEIERFLATGEPEVLSISGRWGVGKTHAWEAVLAASRETTPLRHYAYVSVFGLRSLEAIRTAIVQSTVSLEGRDLEPTVDSFVEHMSSAAGLRKLGAELGRKSLDAVTKGASAIPYVGKLADLIAPGAALLIRNQIVCIDDIERAGAGLDVGDILGLVSSLRERRGCKVVLMLNEDGLGTREDKYREYLEKVVDQAIRFEPTAQESAAAALAGRDTVSTLLAARVITLGIINIRVIRRLRRFLSHLESELANLHPGVADRVVSSLALIGWSVFEPGLAPPMDQVRSRNRYTSILGDEKRTIEQRKVDQTLSKYGFTEFDDLDQVILAGLERGAFDLDALRPLLAALDGERRRNDAFVAINRPWVILGKGLHDDTAAVVAALVEVLETHSADMDAGRATEAFGMLRALGHGSEADRLVPIYVDAQKGKPREFFAGQRYGFSRQIDPAIAAAFERELEHMPLTRDAGGLLVQIGTKNGWNPDDVAYLATVPVEGYRDMLKRLGGDEIHTAIEAALRFGEMQPASENDLTVAGRMMEALTSVARESALNTLRLKRYLPPEGDMAQAPGDSGGDAE